MRNLAIDAGQSGLRARVIETGHQESGGRSFEVDSSAHTGIRTDLPLGEQLAGAVSTLVAEVGTVDTVAIGTTGLTGREDLSGLDVLGLLGIRQLAVAHDSVTSYLGALGAEQGAVVAAGTGVVTLAVGARDVARVDGWGNIIGDAGSAYWFGREALDAAMRAYDGRGPATTLLQRLEAEFGDVETAYIVLQTDPRRVRRVASFARWVTGADAEGDAVASEICKRGAAELACSVHAGMERVAIAATTEIAVCTIGGVFRSEAITRAFLTALRNYRSAFQHLHPRGDGLDGATAMLTLDTNSALQTRVMRIELA
ncbi:hypothetical protein JNB62_05075 [Microbacterium jejuense]|uniref:ATPase BadF/BadG/BcrA/BcrD type domain-containing protein n=1 Tax=Microbacterium jejuense TaxID=1263637 RepID=A0ABS7HJB9_9MICO|nr:BadF/BadG/BcrA/BcrD ATPase family protein [Microbacterium jejuense]MBW9093047.1 hypothetical protein [Microbacterium jejuense]